MCTEEGVQDRQTVRLLSAQNVQLFSTSLFVTTSACFNTVSIVRVSIQLSDSLVLLHCILYVFMFGLKLNILSFCISVV